MKRVGKKGEKGNDPQAEKAGLKPNAWCEQTPDGVILKLQIQPRASKTETAGCIGEPPRLKIRVAAPPVDGEANEELLRFLKKRLELPASHIRLLRGETSKMKDVICAGLSLTQILERLS